MCETVLLICLSRCSGVSEQHFKFSLLRTGLLAKLPVPIECVHVSWTLQGLNFEAEQLKTLYCYSLLSDHDRTLCNGSCLETLEWRSALTDAQFQTWNLNELAGKLASPLFQRTLVPPRHINDMGALSRGVKPKVKVMHIKDLIRSTQAAHFQISHTQLSNESTCLDQMTIGDRPCSACPILLCFPVMFNFMSLPVIHLWLLVQGLRRTATTRRHVQRFNRFQQGVQQSNHPETI